MKKTSTNPGTSIQKFLVVILAVFGLVSAQSTYAHSVDSYAGTCISATQYKVTATVSNVNSSSNYRWQWKNGASWVCFVNGANTINGNSYNVTGSVYNLTTNPGPIIFTNPGSGLQGLEMRMVISDGNGVNPCTLPNGNTWTSTTNHFINIANTACAPCTAKVTSLYFNKLDNGADLPITNGATFTVAQLGSLYNLEASTTGTVGSVKYTITGPTASTNIENATPYNSPSTSGGAWTGAVGTYTVNLKTYSGADASGNLCHDTTITFILTTTGSIGDKVFYDTDRDGLQDGGENGISGVTVKLRNASNTVIATTTTNASGNYLFSGLTAGTYSVEFPVTVYGYILSPAYVGSNRDVDSDPSVTTGITPSITLNTGQNITNIDAGFAPDCACVNSNNNLLVNGSFENGTNGWSWSAGNGSLTTGNGYVACGAANGFNNQSSGTSKVWQDVTVSVGSTVTFSAYAGTHTPGISCSPKLSLIFLNSANAIIGQTDVTVTRDVDVYNGQLAKYSITAVAPAGTVKARVQSSITCNTMKLDAFCLTATPVLGSIGDKVFYDTDRDGIQDGGENGISGVTVKLRNASNAVVATTTTNAGGNYLFSGLTAGTYSVEFPVTVYGYILSPAYVGSNRDVDSDPSVSTGITPAITLAIGQNITNIDAGFAPDCACVNSNNNLLVNGSFENGITGWNASGGTITTGNGYVACGAANGFNNWSTGTSKVWQDVTVSAGATVNFSAYAGTHTPGITCSPKLSLIFLNSANAIIGQTDVTVTRDVDVNSSQLALYSITAVAPAGTVKARVQSSITCNTMKLDAFCLTATIPANLNLGNFVWYDADNDGVQDVTEPGISGATVKLYVDANSDNVPDGAAIATTTTSGTGAYGFGSLTARNYIVGVTLPAGYTGATTTATSATPNNDNNTDNNGVTIVSGELRSNFITLSVGGEPTTDGDGNNGNLTLDFGLKGAGSIGDYVWEDLNRNGSQDGNEPGISGATVTLTTPTGTVTTTTNASGAYNFPNLLPGTYSLAFSTPVIPAASYLETPSNIGANDLVDSDPIAGIVSNIVLTAGETNNTFDAGFFKVVTLSGNVWHDVNALTDNLVNNSGAVATPVAPAIPVGLRAYLMNSSTGLIEKVAFVSSATGAYTFNNVNANTNYVIVLSNISAVVGSVPPLAALPAGWQNTGEKLGISTGSDGVINGRLPVQVLQINVTNANFGIRLKNGEVIIG